MPEGNVRFTVVTWLLPLLILTACSGKGSKPCGSQTASIAYVKDLGKPNLEALAKTGQGPRFFASSMVSYTNYAQADVQGTTGSTHLTGNCSGLVSFEDPSNPKDIRLWTGEHCIVLGRTKDVKVKLFYNGGYLEFSLDVGQLEKDSTFRKSNNSKDVKLVGLVSESTQEQGNSAGFENCQEDFERSKKQRGPGVNHICYTPFDLVTFKGNITANLTTQHTTILQSLHHIYWEKFSLNQQVSAMAKVMENLMDLRTQRRIITSLKEVARCKVDKELCFAEDAKVRNISYAASPEHFPQFLALAKEYYPSFLDPKVLTTADFTDVAKLTSLEKSLKQQELSQTSALFDKLFADPQAPLVLFMSTRYSGETYYQAAKIPIGFDSSGNKVTGLDPLVQSVRIDKEKNVVVILAPKGKIFDHELGDSGAILGTAPNTLGFLAMSTLNGEPSTTLRAIPTKEPQPTQQTPPETRPVGDKQNMAVKDKQQNNETTSPEQRNNGDYRPLPPREQNDIKEPLLPWKPVADNNPQSNAEGPDPTKMQDRGIYNPSSSPESSNQTADSNDSWRTASSQQADNRVILPKENIGNGCN